MTDMEQAMPARPWAVINRIRGVSSWLRTLIDGTPRPVFRLTEADRPSLFLHYIALSGSDRRSRFHGRLRYDALLERSRTIDLDAAVILGRCAARRLIAVSEVLPTSLDGAPAMELAVSVCPHWQHKGIAFDLVQSALDVVWSADLSLPVVLYTAADNHGMLRLCSRLHGACELLDGEYRFVFRPGPGGTRPH